MLIFNFTRIFKSRGIDKPFNYFKKAGYSNNFATKLSNNRHVRLDLKYIEKLCVLFNCTPNDFIEWIPDKGEKNIDNHPLKSLRRNDKVVSLSKMLHSIPVDRLNEIEEIIKKECDKKDE